MKNESNVEQLVAAAEAVDANVIREAQANLEKRAREAKVRQFETAIQNADGYVLAAVNELRNARKAERIAREKVARLAEARKTLVDKGDGLPFARAYYKNANYTEQQIDQNATVFVTNTLGLPVKSN